MAGTTPHANPPRIPPRLRMKLHRRRLTPLFVWLAVLIVAVAIQIRKGGGLRVTGFAEEVRYAVAAETAGRLERLAVERNATVFRGQVVAAFEAADLRLRLREARAELDRLADELDRDRTLRELAAAELRADRRMDRRRLARDVSSARIAHLSALADLGEDRIALQGLQLTLDRTRQLAAGDALSTAALDEDRVACEALAERVARQETTVAALQEAHRDAEARYRDLLESGDGDAPGSAPPSEPLASAIAAQEVRIEMVTRAIGERLLRAPADGRVAEVFHRAGEVVAAGEPVLSIVQPHATELVAYLPERRMFGLRPGDPVEIRRAADPGRTYVSEIAALGASVERMPPRVDPAGAVPRWGLAVFIPLPGSVAARPGEAFTVSF